MVDVENLEILIDIDVDRAISALEALDEAIDRVDRAVRNVDNSTIRIFTNLVDERTQAKLDRLDEKRIAIPLDITRVGTETTKVETAIASLEAQSIDIPVNFEMDNTELARILQRRASLPAGMAGPELPENARELSVRHFVEMDGVDTSGIKEALEKLSADTGGQGRAMRKAADAAEEATGGMKLFNLRMTDMHNALAKMIPLLLVFIGALPALIGGLVTLATAAVSAAAALGALAGFGALGFALARGGRGNISESLQELTSEIRDSFLDAFEPLARDLAPFMESAVDGLRRFFEAVASRGQVLKDLRDVARDFGEFVLDFAPEAIAEMGRFTDAMAPVFGMLGDFIEEMDLLRGMADFFAQALPALTRFGALLADSIPDLLMFSIGMLRVTAGIIKFLSAIGSLIKSIATLGGLLNITNEQFGLVIGLLLTAVTATALWNSQLLIAARTALASLAKSLIGAIGHLGAYSASAIVSAGASKLAAAGVRILTGAILGLLAISGIGILISILGTLAGQFMNTSNNVDEATKSLERFGKTADKIDGTTIGTQSGQAGVQRGAVGTSSNNSVTVNADGVDREDAEGMSQRALFKMSKI